MYVWEWIALEAITDIPVENISLLSKKKASEEMKIGKKRINSMIQNGEIRVIEFDNGTVKIPKSELIRWVRERQQYNVTRQPENGVKTRKVPAFDTQLVMKKIIRGKGCYGQRKN